MNTEDDEFKRIEREIKMRSVPVVTHHTLKMVFNAMSYGNAADRELARLAVGAALAEQPAQEEPVAWHAEPFNPDYNTEAVLVEEQQRMAQRILELEALLERQAARIVDLQTHIENFDGEDR